MCKYNYQQATCFIEEGYKMVNMVKVNKELT